MTDKEQIMIDGVDVSGCKYLGNGRICNAEREEDGYTDWACCNPELNDCYFKQLARKTQECEELKEKLRIKDNENSNLNKKYRQEQNEKRCYRKALEEIEEIVNEPCTDSQSDCKSCNFSCEHKDILDIINKAKGEMNELHN